MNKRALVIGLLYCIAVIAFKLFILLGGYTLTRFGFYYSNIVGVFAIIPFFVIAVYVVREKDFGGIISGKDAVRMSLTVLAVAAIVVSVYNYIEFDWKYRDIAVEYYNSPEYMKILEDIKAKNPGKVTMPLPDIIKAQIGDLSAGKATTGKLFPLILIGLSGAFVTAMFMKRGSKKA
ncbi:MAG: hypothetical protein K0S32_1879 [Bacteroidetes bacterium]|jgi:hypothetical protein|nr:hypothetical protein [Bacteroidota bacterium]